MKLSRFPLPDLHHTARRNHEHEIDEMPPLQPGRPQDSKPTAALSTWIATQRSRQWTGHSPALQVRPSVYTDRAARQRDSRENYLCSRLGLHGAGPVRRRCAGPQLRLQPAIVPLSLRLISFVERRGDRLGWSTLRQSETPLRPVRGPRRSNRRGGGGWRSASRTKSAKSENRSRAAATASGPAGETAHPGGSDKPCRFIHRPLHSSSSRSVQSSRNVLGYPVSR